MVFLKNHKYKYIVNIGGFLIKYKWEIIYTGGFQLVLIYLYMWCVLPTNRAGGGYRRGLPP
jgi:hypothetical protein